MNLHFLIWALNGVLCAACVIVLILARRIYSTVQVFVMLTAIFMTAVVFFSGIKEII